MTNEARFLEAAARVLCFKRVPEVLVVAEGARPTRRSDDSSPWGLSSRVPQPPGKHAAATSEWLDVFALSFWVVSVSPPTSAAKKKKKKREWRRG